MASSSTQTLALQSDSREQIHFMEKLMVKIFSFYDEQALTDVTFKVSNPTAFIPAHRLILAAASPYFEDLFNGDQGNNPVLEINDIDSDIFECLITFCYTGKTLITVNNVGAMLKAAIVLKLDDAITRCVSYLMSHINEYSLQGVYTLEREARCELLKQKIIEYETNNFMEISRRGEFLNFDVEKMQRILESDNLNITREEDAFDAIKRWFNYDVPARQEHLPLLIACLRLTQFDADFLLTHIQPLPGCELLAFKALSWISKPEARTKINIRFTGPRRVEASPWIRKPETQPKINMQIKGPGGVDAFSFIREPEAQPKINMQVKGPSGVEAVSLNREPEARTKINMRFTEPSGITNFSRMREPEQRPKINMRFTRPGGIKEVSWNIEPAVRTLNAPFTFSASNCGEKTLLAICSGMNPKLLQYNKAEDKWQEYASIKFDYQWYRTILKDDNLLFLGGYKTGATSNIVRSWNIRNKAWQSLPAMNKARCSHCVVELDGKIYAIGGSDGNNALSSLERYTTFGGWQFMNSLIVGRYDASAVTLNSKIYIMGGRRIITNLKSVECYNPDSNTWTSCADMTECDRLPVAAAHNGHIYVLGSNCRTGNLNSVVERYDPQRNTWSKICSLEVSGYSIACVSLDNKLWAVSFDGVSVYDEQYDRWGKKCALPEPIIRSCFAVPIGLLTSK